MLDEKFPRTYCERKPDYVLPENPPERNRMVARYELDCVDCSFQTVVVGEYMTVLEEIQAHQRDQDADPAGHFVNVHRRD